MLIGCAFYGAQGSWTCRLILLVAVCAGLYYLLHYFNQLEQRDLDDAETRILGRYRENDDT
jgi:hypothetical protein